MNVERVMDRAIEHYGVEKQLLVCIEELSELIKAITKAERYPNDDIKKDDIAEEMADVYICLEYLAKIYSISDEKISHNFIYKLMRLNERMDSER